jgi:hypothetical protein
MTATVSTGTDVPRHDRKSKVSAAQCRPAFYPLPAAWFDGACETWLSAKAGADTPSSNHALVLEHGDLVL